ncbi:response regulator [Massilia sp. W12]|uniref:response regulator n=1 Tax=Massilia sp. W12 TaxID=3126507 RepID=UPI0030D21769
MDDTRKVLVVDDSRVSRLMSRQFILSLRPGWQVEEAATGEDALQRVSEYTPDLVLMDVNMPGMGGLAAAEKLRQLHPDCRITLLTANVQDATRNKAIALGVGFVEKPITEARIREVVDSLGSQPCST